jgi:signal transduction protein PmrD
MTTDAVSIQNKNENQRLKITSASAFSATQWCSLKKSCKSTLLKAKITG